MCKSTKSGKLVHGIGTKGMRYPTRDEINNLKEYNLWADMLRRCTPEFWNERPAYTGVTCSENFKSYEYFYEWCQQQNGFRSKHDNGRFWHLDKDILVRGNKVYSEDTCVFLPQNINLLITDSKGIRGKYPIGVTFDSRRNKFQSRCHDGTGTLKHLGLFYTAEDAFQAYKVYKEVLIKQVANEYRTQIDPRAYQALLNYTVEITD